MTTLSDDQLLLHAARARDKVVVITGGAKGIGKATARLFAQYGAKVVIGDLDVASGQATVANILKEGGDAVFVRCDVTVWDDQVALFDLAWERHGAVDIVIPNAGLAMSGPICDGNVAVRDGKMVPPSLRTLEVNINAVFYTCHLGVHCIQRNRAPDDLKAVILIGSMASWQAIPRAEEYTASKHAMLGLMRALDKTLGALSIRVGIVHPWFADTTILPLPVKLALAGIPLASVPRIARAVFAAALDPDPATRGLPWTVPDDGPVFLLDREYLREGVYALMDARVARLQRLGEGVRRTVAVIRDVAGYLGLEGGVAMMGLVLAFGAVILGTMDGVQ